MPYLPLGVPIRGPTWPRLLAMLCMRPGVRADRFAAAAGRGSLNTPVPSLESKRNGHHIDNGKPGQLVFRMMTPGLAKKWRQLGFRAVCHYTEPHLAPSFDERRTVVVAYQSDMDAAAANLAADQALTQFHAERAGVLDLINVFGFSGHPDSFADWFDEGAGTGKFEDSTDFLRLAEDRTVWTVREHAYSDPTEGSDEVIDPIGNVDPRAFHGPLGRIALETQSETEANPLFVLAHLMAFFGAAVGRNPHFIVSGTRHCLNLFVGLIGLSGSSRKGMAGDVALAIFQRVDSWFTGENITDGLNSGAGLLWQIRDKMFQASPDGPVVCDEGVDDKRRVFLESELASVLKSGHRESDPITEHLRKFWDGKECVRSSTRKDPLKVTGGHVGIVGHATPADIETHLSDVDRRNGTANRFIWLFGTRSKRLPRGGNVFGLLDFIPEKITPIINAIQFGQSIQEIQRTAAAEKRWEELYHEFDDVPTGRLGSFFVRAAPQVLRMAAIFALADQRALIDVEHLEAALAIWNHSGRSLRFMFPDDSDPAADKLMAALRNAGDGGLTKREITNDVFNKHRSAEELDELLGKLLAYRLITQTTVKGKGRPSQRYSVNRWGVAS
jgi:hypothetical protein